MERSGSALRWLMWWSSTEPPISESAIEEHFQGGMHSGIGMIRGWAVSSDPIERVEVFIDGVYRFDIPHGGKRRDVGKHLRGHPQL